MLFVSGFVRMPSGTLPATRPSLLAFGLAVVFGGLIELHQGYILTNRTADIYDFIANCIGALIGLRLIRNGKLKSLLDILYPEKKEN